jgi:outer membrane protein OmpA-like peptidoglycan-associated protein
MDLRDQARNPRSAWIRRYGLVLLAAGLVACAPPCLPGLSPPAASAQTQAAPEPADPLARARALRDQARQLGARNTVPAAWNTYEKKLNDLSRATPSAEAIAALEAEGRRLVNRAAFLQEVRDSRSPLENLLARYDRTLRELAAMLDTPLDATLTGDSAATRLLELVEADRRRGQVRIDSLVVQNRHLQEQIGGRIAAQDSLITVLRVELSALRQRLWETELRAGVAEADRSAAESVLARRQAREAAVREILAELGDKAGAVMRPDGTIVLQVHGIDFAVGSADLAPGQADLMNSLAAAVKRFPGAAIRVEGHTDDTGSRSANLTLSTRRAATVAGGIQRRLDLPSGSIDTVGHGPDQPVAPNSTAEGRARNRRIDIVIMPRD